MKVLVFGAHPDDLEIGMGGTIAKHVSVGDTVLMVVTTIPSQRECRREEAQRGAAILGDDHQDGIANTRPSLRAVG